MVGSGPGLLLRIGPEDRPRQQVKPGTLRRIIPYALRYRWSLVTLVVSTAIDSCATVATPVLLGLIIDDAILPRKVSVLIELTIAAAALGLALADAAALRCSSFLSS
jgi:ATP-binding cassette subfamily B protein